MNYNLGQPFFESAQKYPDKQALFADGESYSYRDVLDRVVRVADWLSVGNEGRSKRVGILGSRSLEACVGILAAAWVGAAYVPISLKQPELGIAELLKGSGLSDLIADRTGSHMLTPRLLEQSPPKVLFARGRSSYHAYDRTPITYSDELPPARHVGAPAAVGSDALAYILYTSGSTGVPKGVMIPAGAVHHLLQTMQAKYPLSPEDRIAETTDISFDLSVYNMFAAWRSSASLHVIPATQAMAPAKFLQEQRITTWLSVPSIAAFMRRMGLLTPNSLMSLRYSFFAGEPLLVNLAETWRVAAPHSVIANLYGPTEATVVCIGQAYDSHSTFTRDCVAIGKPFPGIQVAIADGDKEFVPEGELLLAGPQLALGYLDDPEKTADRFVFIGGHRWYRTGDLAHRDGNGIVHYLGRMDSQVKILGYRVELEEIECHLRNSTGCVDVAAVAWPFQSGSASGIVAFLVNHRGPTEGVKAALQSRLPSYMVPSKFCVLPELPTNSSGKVDRIALVKMLEAGIT